MVSKIFIGVIYYIFTCYLYGCKSGTLIYTEIQGGILGYTNQNFYPMRIFSYLCWGRNKRMEQTA